MLSIKPNLLVGGLLVVLGLLFNYARNKPNLAEFLSSLIFGDKDALFKPNETYSFWVKWFGWESIGAGVTIMLPTHLLLDLFAGAFVVAVCTWSFFRINKSLSVENDKNPVPAPETIETESDK